MDDAKPKKKKSNKLRNLLIDVVTLFVIIIVAVLAFVIFGQADGGSTTGDTVVNITSLKCRKSGTDNIFIRQQYAPVSGEHTITANFKESKLTDAMYSYTANYGSGVDLSAAKVSMHAEFDIAYGNALVHDAGVWSEGFSVSEANNQIRMSVYSEANNLNSNNAAVFMLPARQAFPKTLNDMKTAYEATGFSCQVSE